MLVNANSESWFIKDQDIAMWVSIIRLLLLNVGQMSGQGYSSLKNKLNMNVTDENQRFSGNLIVNASLCIWPRLRWLWESRLWV